MSKLDVLFEELVTANRILAREGIVDFVRPHQRAASGQSGSLLHVAGAGAGLRRGRRPHGVHAPRESRQSRRKPLCRALHPWRHLGGAARCEFGGAQSFAERDPVRRDGHEDQADPAHVRQCRRTRCRSGIRKTRSATPRCWSTASRWAAISPRRWAGRTILMRGHGATVGPNIRHAVFVANYLEVAPSCRCRRWRWARSNSSLEGEVDKIIERTGPYTINRAWENWCRRANRPVTPQAAA